MSGLDWAMLLALSILWGGSFFFYKVLVATLPPLTIVFGRVLIAALLLNLLLALRRDPMPGDGATWRAFLLMGLLNNVMPFGLLIYGETRIASGPASILNATTPMFTVLMAHLFTGERASATKLAGIRGGRAVRIRGWRRSPRPSHCRRRRRQELFLDHDVFGLNQSKDMNVIDSNRIEHDLLAFRGDEMFQTASPFGGSSGRSPDEISS